MPYNFTTIDKKWQQHWLDHKCFAAMDPAVAGDAPKAFILDMFPYPSGSGLHVGHPVGYTATDIFSRFLRMKGYNVMHPMGWDAFGLPAEQHAIKTGEHPAANTRRNVDNFRRQIRMLGLSYDWDREVDTTDPRYFRWTQWIFLQLFNSYYDPAENKARPIARLIHQLESGNFVAARDGTIHLNSKAVGAGSTAAGETASHHWSELTPAEQRDLVDSQRLAFTDEIPVNWCPGLGTVLANEEIIDGRSAVGRYPVERRPMRQWMLRITAYADRLLNDLQLLDWPESLKEMQRNWIGRSIGAEVDFAVGEVVITVFTTRPDTLYGATYIVLAPEHALVDRITTPGQRDAVSNYRAEVAGKSERDRMADTKEKTGAFTGAYAVNPANRERVPVFIADYVLTGYGTGAIMAVPAHDERDFDFARKFKLPIRAVVQPTDAWLRSAGEDLPVYASNPGAYPSAFGGEGIAVNSGPLDGLTTAEAKAKMIARLEDDQTGRGSINYKLRDWLFSRQRYWGEPFPIVLDDDQRPTAILENELPLTLPDMDDFRPTGTPEPPLSKAKQWLHYERDGKVFTRETNTMPQWAGSCWYYLRYIDPKNDTQFVDPAKEKYWMPVDLYVGGVEHAVLHLLYSRFWHKVLFDLGHVSSPEPFKRLVNQGMILGEMEYHVFEDESDRPVSLSEVRNVEEEATDEGPKIVALARAGGAKLFGRRLTEEDVEKDGDGYHLRANPEIRVDARRSKMSKSRGNVVNPDDIVKDYGADVFRLYEMYMGPLEAQKPWNTRDIVGMSRFLGAIWRNLANDREVDKSPTLDDSPIPDALDRQMHRTIKKVGEDIAALRFNSAIAELIKLNNEITGRPTVSRKLAETLTLLLAPFAPHIAEELWQRLGHEKSLARHPWPIYDESKLVESTMEVPVQVNGKLRGKATVPADSTADAVLAAARAVDSVGTWLAGKTVKKEIYVPGKLVNFVVV